MRNNFSATLSLKLSLAVLELQSDLQYQPLSSKKNVLVILECEVQICPQQHDLSINCLMLQLV